MRQRDIEREMLRNACVETVIAAAAILATAVLIKWLLGGRL